MPTQDEVVEADAAQSEIDRIRSQMVRLQALQSRKKQEAQTGNAHAFAPGSDQDRLLRVLILVEDRLPGSLADAFNRFDTDKDGALTVDELHGSLRELGACFKDFTRDDVQRLVSSSLDTNQDQQVQLAEFVAFVCNGRAYLSNQANGTSPEEGKTGPAQVETRVSGAACEDQNDVKAQEDVDVRLDMLAEPRSKKEKAKQVQAPGQSGSGISLELGWFWSQPASSAEEPAIISWFRSQPVSVAAAVVTTDWFRGQPASSASDAKIIGWFRGQPWSVAAAAATADWFGRHPTGTASDAEIVEWFRGQPLNVSAVGLTAGWVRGRPASGASDAQIATWCRTQPHRQVYQLAVEWFRKQPASTASNAEVIEWFRGQPTCMSDAEAAADATAAWFQSKPKSNADNSEVVDWFRGQPTVVAAASATASFFRGLSTGTSAPIKDARQAAYKAARQRAAPDKRRVQQGQGATCGSCHLYVCMCASALSPEQKQAAYAAARARATTQQNAQQARVLPVDDTDDTDDDDMSLLSSLQTAAAEAREGSFGDDSVASSVVSSVNPSPISPNRTHKTVATGGTAPQYKSNVRLRKQEADEEFECDHCFKFSGSYKEVAAHEAKCISVLDIEIHDELKDVFQ